MSYLLRQQEILAAFGTFALQTHSMEELLQEATRASAEGLRCDHAKALEYLPSEEQFIVRAGVGWKEGIVGHARIAADLESPAGYAFKTGKPVISNHLEQERRFRTPRLLMEHGIRRAINVLIALDEDRFGVLGVDSPEGERFTEADAAFLKGFANLLNLAIGRHLTEARLKEALRHQEVLNDEISHRVKNSLAIVASLLRMQRLAAVDPGLQNALSDAQRRVETIANVHDRLWRSRDERTVDLAEFLNGLCEQFCAEGLDAKTLKCDAVPVTVVTEQAVTIGLLTNELITNALKYAYPNGTGDISLSLARSEQPTYLRIMVCDHGVGLPRDMDTGAPTSLGMKLISRLARELGGRPEWQNAQPGTRFVLDFPARELR
ncbi:sensor histidine kinase [Pseudaminobacter soli (ex Zhang et al. 2022)]|uniref:sensor histidine kinase n=1 Tax=Pseudaminobacter soli (ex Zhang et al. 2022) TaxID=2831468 RepID=UPI001F01C18B|nr:histidine kinase dimerization/phosphoacceptor domain -containing protein [Pseudaminobacter soli]